MILIQGTPLLLATSLAILAPTINGIYSAIAILIFCSGIYLFKNTTKKQLFTYSLFALVFLIFSLTGIISLELSVIAFASSLLFYFFPKYRHFSLFFLFFASPLFHVLALFLAGKLPAMMEQSAPNICALLILIIIFNKDFLKLLAFIFCTFIFTYVSWLFNLEVSIAGLINALIFSLSIFFLKDSEVLFPKVKAFLAITFLIIHSVFIFSIANPISKNNIFIWLPDDPEKFESQFFNDYVYTLKLVGINGKKISKEQDIEKGAVILVPWATHPEAADFLTNLKNTPIAKSLTVIIGGEHTNYGNYANRINPVFSNSVSFENTTTIPPKNANNFGPLWTGSILQFPFDTTLNRGSSLRINKLNVVPLLVAKSIFSDLGPSEVNDFWVGDFLLGHEDPRGWTLLMAGYRDGPLWILAGDNSFFLNKYLIQKPEALLHAIVNSSLYPVLFLEVWLIFLMGILCLSISNSSDQVRWNKFIFISPFALLIAFYVHFYYQKSLISTSNIDISSGLTFFAGDQRSSSSAISILSKKIIESEKKLFVHEDSFSFDNVGKSGRSEIHIGHLKGDVHTSKFGIDRCGLTNYTSSTYPKVVLFEAQYCRVFGEVQVILGAEGQASIIKLETSPPTFLILDRYFLSGSPPNLENLEFIKKLLD